MSSVLEALRKRSASPRELVLAYADALKALTELQRHNARVLGWEGWLRHPDGRVGHSADHQGTADLSSLDFAAAYELCRTSIREAQTQFDSQPERSGCELLFCITYDV